MKMGDTDTTDYNKLSEAVFYDPEFDSEYCKQVFRSLENNGTACDFLIQ